MKEDMYKCKYTSMMQQSKNGVTQISPDFFLRVLFCLHISAKQMFSINIDLNKDS